MGLGIAALALGARYLPITTHVVVIAALLSPYLMPLALPSAILLALSRRWFLTATAFCVAVAAVLVELPLYVGSGVDGTRGTVVRVLTANLRLGVANPQYLVASASDNADVVAVQELTPDAVQRLAAAGMNEAFPYYALDAREEADGVGLWSRYPIRDSKPRPGTTKALISAHIQVSGVHLDPTIVVAHMSGPWPWPITDWRSDFDVLAATLATVAERAGQGAVILAGDLNSTLDERPFRDLLSNGYRDAAEQVGAGLRPTWPADLRVPPFIAIDHVIVRNCAASSVRTTPLPGSDHRGLIATVEIP